ncbi:MAG: DUF2252 family protein, partial [Candidatus Eremiobacteraeota bacterium]|nr:DUF2252 family protein [Candidatus Eremiobacteraeota bacterium]
MEISPLKLTRPVPVRTAAGPPRSEAGDSYAQAVEGMSRPDFSFAPRPLALDGLEWPALEAAAVGGGVAGLLALSDFTSVRPLREARVAVDFIGGFHQQLGLDSNRLAERVALMCQSPFLFFRANPALFHADLHGAYQQAARLFDQAAPTIAINGDSHMGNYGTFKGPGGEAVWGLNDFDQAGLGSPEADLERLAVSLMLLAAEEGLGRKYAEKMVARLADDYFEAVAELAEGRRELGPAYLTQPDSRAPVSDLIKAAESRGQDDLLDRFVESGRFRSDDPELVPLEPQTQAGLRRALEDFDRQLGPAPRVARPLEPLDLVAKTHSGGSSRGLERYYVLVKGANPDEPVILEFKQLLPSPVECQDGDLSRADAAAAVAFQKQMGGLTNPLTGSVDLNGSSFLVRERETEKGSFKGRDLDTRKSFQEAVEQAALVLARSHCPTREQALRLADWSGKGKKQAGERLVEFARRYTSQTVADGQA